MKGQLEEGLKEAGFKSLVILRPGMLLGDRSVGRARRAEQRTIKRLPLGLRRQYGCGELQLDLAAPCLEDEMQRKRSGQVTVHRCGLPPRTSGDAAGNMLALSTYNTCASAGSFRKFTSLHQCSWRREAVL